MSNAHLIIQSAKWTYMHLYWSREVAPYTSDTSMYIWQPHLEPIVPLGASICIGPLTAQGRDSFIYFRVSNHARDSASKIYQSMYSSVPNGLKASSILSIRVFSTVFAVYRILITDTAKFIDSVNSQIQNVVRAFYFTVSSIIYGSLPWCKAHTDPDL